MQYDFQNYIRIIPDYPKEGIVFQDIMPLLSNASAFHQAIQAMIDEIKRLDLTIDVISAIEARGFILGSAMATAMGVGFLPIRKKGKLPGKTLSLKYDLEYGQDELEIQQDIVSRGTKILLVDDLIATGGSAVASVKLLQKLELDVKGACFLINLKELGGAKKLETMKIPCCSVINVS